MADSRGQGCDLLIISPHTDDAEIGLGGTIRLLADKGRQVWALDLTRGELGSNATPAERWEAGKAAAAVLGLAGRLQLDLPDGFVDGNDPGQCGAVVDILRRLCPRWVVTAPEPVRHPDHVRTPVLVERALFLSRLVAYRPEARTVRLWLGGELPERREVWVPEASFAVCPDGGSPDLLFDVSATWAAKEEALACYASQFRRGPGRRPTMINDDAFLERIARRGRTWGRRAGVAYAEALCGSAAPVMGDMPAEAWT